MTSTRAGAWRRRMHPRKRKVFGPTEHAVACMKEYAAAELRRLSEQRCRDHVAALLLLLEEESAPMGPVLKHWEISRIRAGFPAAARAAPPTLPGLVADGNMLLLLVSHIPELADRASLSMVSKALDAEAKAHPAHFWRMDHAQVPELDTYAKVSALLEACNAGAGTHWKSVRLHVTVPHRVIFAADDGSEVRETGTGGAASGGVPLKHCSHLSLCPLPGGHHDDAREHAPGGGMHEDDSPGVVDACHGHHRPEEILQSPAVLY